MSVVKGYCFGRSIDGSFISQKIQNLVIFNYCKTHELALMPNLFEHNVKSSFRVLEEDLDYFQPELSGYVFFSVRMLIETSDYKASLVSRICNNFDLHFASENIRFVRGEVDKVFNLLSYLDRDKRYRNVSTQEYKNLAIADRAFMGKEDCSELFLWSEINGYAVREAMRIEHLKLIEPTCLISLWAGIPVELKNIDNLNDLGADCVGFAIATTPELEDGAVKLTHSNSMNETDIEETISGSQILIIDGSLFSGLSLRSHENVRMFGISLSETPGLTELSGVGDLYPATRLGVEYLLGRDEVEKID